MTGNNVIDRNVFGIAEIAQITHSDLVKLKTLTKRKDFVVHVTA